MAEAPTLADLVERIDRLLSRDRPWPAWMGIDTATEYADVSSASIRRFISSGRLTAHRPCRGKVLISRRELDSLIRTATSDVRRSRGHHLLA